MKKGLWVCTSESLRDRGLVNKGKPENFSFQKIDLYNIWGCS